MHLEAILADGLDVAVVVWNRTHCKHRHLKNEVLRDQLSLGSLDYGVACLQVAAGFLELVVQQSAEVVIEVLVDP